MKHFCLCFMLFFIIPITGWGQSSYIHISASKLDTALVSCFGESLIKLSKNKFNNERAMINFNPVIPFDGEQDYMEIVQSIADLSQITIFTVFKSENNSTEEAEIWGLHGEETALGLTTKRAYSTSKQSYYPGVKPNSVVLNTFSQSYSSSLTYPNKKSFISLGIAKKETVNSLFKGSIAEIIAYKKILRGSERQKIETALAIKHGITLTNEKNYIISNKKAIWDRVDASMYSNNIAGIGHDDDLGVYQRQSTSSNAPGFLIIGAGEISTSNKKNKSILNNYDFLVWGDNGGELTLLPKDKETCNLPILQRKWLIKSSGHTSNTLKTQLRVDANLLFDGLKKKDDYLLVIDRSGTGDFSTENTEFVTASSISEAGMVTFDNIFWDTDNSGKDVFSFTLKKGLEVTLTGIKSLKCPGETTSLIYSANGGIPPYSYTLQKNNLDGYRHWNSKSDLNLENRIEDIPKGAYTLTVSDHLESKKIVTFDIVEENDLDMDLGPDQTLQFEQELQLHAQISSPDKVLSYEWTDDNGFLNTQEKILITAAGTYSLMVRSESGCEYSDEIVIHKSKIKEFEIYPNPTLDGNYNIAIELAEKADFNVNIFNLHGVKVSSFELKNEIDIDILGESIGTPGVYQVVLETPHETTSKKLIVE